MSLIRCVLTQPYQIGGNVICASFLRHVTVDQVSLGGEKSRRPCNVIDEFSQKVTKTHVYNHGFSSSRCGIHSAFHENGFMTTKVVALFHYQCLLYAYTLDWHANMISVVSCQHY